MKKKQYYCNIDWMCDSCIMEKNKNEEIRTKWICDKYNVILEQDNELRIIAYCASTFNK